MACLVFDDPFHISGLDRADRGEERWQTIGMVGGGVLLLVAHTWEEFATGELQIQIISARRARKLERAIYDEGI